MKWPNPGTQKSRRLLQRLKTKPKMCPGGDCLCDWHEGVLDKINSRAFRNRSLPNLSEEYDEYLDEVVWTRTDRCGNLLPPYERGDPRFWTSRLDYAYDADDGCGDWCPCGVNLHYWMDWLRAQEVYPPPSLLNPVIGKYEDN